MRKVFNILGMLVLLVGSVYLDQLFYRLKFISQFSAYYPALDRTAGLSCFRFFVISFGLDFIDRQSTQFVGRF